MALKGRLRDLLVSTIGEFVGTFMFLFISYAAVQTVNQPAATGASSTGPDPSKLLFISFAFGFSLAVNVWIFFRVSGGQFNPAVTLALCIVGAVPFITALCIIAAQILAAMTAAIVVKIMIPGNTVRFAVSLATGVNNTQGFFIEMFTTFQLVFTVLMLAVEKTKGTFIAPLGIGLSLFLGHIVSAFWTGAGINPARAFGSAVAATTFPSYHWIYWIGPIVGALLAAGLHRILGILEYEKVNGDQDKSIDEESLGPLLARQTDEIKGSLRRWGPRSYGSNVSNTSNRGASGRGDTKGWPMSPHSYSSKGRMVQPLRLYRISGPDPFDEEQEAFAKPTHTEHEFVQSRYPRSEMPPSDRPRSPREF